MKNLRIAPSLALAAGVLALAQMPALAAPEEVPPLYDDPSAFLARVFSSEADPFAESSPAEPASMQTIGGFPHWSIGGALAIAGARRQNGTSMFGELELRWWPLDYFALKLAGSPYRALFDHHTLSVEEYPVTLSVMWTPFPRGEWSPYLIAGAGWYYSKATYRGSLEGVFPDSTSSKIGFHGGAGLEWIYNSASFFFEGTYAVVDPKLSGLSSNDFNHWQALIGLTFRF